MSRVGAKVLVSAAETEAIRTRIVALTSPAGAADAQVGRRARRAGDIPDRRRVDLSRRAALPADHQGCRNREALHPCLVALAMLFFGGLALGRYAGYGSWKAVCMMAGLGTALVLAINALGG